MKPFTASLKVMVTVAVSPAASAVSSSSIVAVGRRVSMVKGAELAVASLTLPAASCTVPARSVTTAADSSVPASGVKVAVQVRASSASGCRLDRAPPATSKSAVARPATASEKTMVTVACSSTRSVSADSVTVAVGRLLSTE